jgi:hypothetical protein
VIARKIAKKNVICNSSIKICLNQSVLTVTYFYFHFISAFNTFLGNEKHENSNIKTTKDTMDNINEITRAMTDK